MKWFGGEKELTEMDRVMENIAQVEGELQQKIFQLGHLYYENNKDKIDPQSEYFVLMDMINKLEQNRKGFYKNKLRLEGSMLCESCGAVIPYGSMYCNVCGKRADEKQEDDAAGTSQSKCKKCGAVLSDGSLFCTACGTKVE